MDHPDYTLEWLLSPTQPEQFLTECWERRPLVLSRRDDGYYRSVLSLADMDRILSSHDLRHPAVQLFKNNVQVPPPEYTAETDNVVELVKLYAQYQQGATIIVENLHRGWLPLGRLCASMERFFSHPGQTNVYLTPPNAQGFGAHYDTHDVFILQMAGSKRWRLYGTPVPMPLASMPAPRPGPDPGQPSANIVLQTGDLLYIPRGLVHDAATTDSVSLHVTLGINTYTWADLFMEAFHTLCKRDVRFRRSLPLGFARNGGASSWIREEGAALLKSLVDDGLPVEETAEAMAERFVRTRLPLLDGHLMSLTDGDTINAQSLIRKRAWMYRLTVAGDRVDLLYHGKGLKFARSLEPALRFALGNEKFEVSALPGNLSEKDKIALVKLLIEEGLLMAVKRTQGDALG